MASKAITFDGYDLQNTTFTTKDVVYRNMPSRTIDIEQLSRRDGFRVINAYYTQKDIRISGNASAASETTLRTALDAMKTALNKTEKNLDITDGSTTVRWVCSVVNIDIPEQHYHITRVPYDITFRCQPFGIATSTTTNTNSMTDTESSSIVIIGSAQPKPTITWTVSGTPSSAITGITFYNSTTGDTFGVTGLVLSGDTDYLMLNTDTMSAVYNTGSGDVVVDFSGVIPSFTTSTNSYTTTISGGGASKTIMQTITYSASYL